MTNARELPTTLAEFKALAEQQLPAGTWDYVAGGAGDEHTLLDNEHAWQRAQLWPHVLVDVGAVDTTLQLLDLNLAHPIVLAPTAAHAMYHDSAEAGSLAGASAASALAVMSSLGSTPVAEIGRLTAEPWWLQLYVQP